VSEREGGERERGFEGRGLTLDLEHQSPAAAMATEKRRKIKWK